MSQAIASSQPPPKASPLTAAMVIVLERSQSRSSACAESSSSRPAASSIFVNALMSAPAQNSAGLGEARIIALISGAALDRLPRRPQPGDHVGRDRVGGRVVDPHDRHRAARVELDLRRLVARVGLRIGVEALAALGAEAALGHEPAQDQRRLEVLAPLLLGALQRGEHVVEPAEVGAGERAGDHPGAHHHPEVDVADAGDALLEHEAGLDERLQREALDQRRRRRPGEASASVLIEALPALLTEVALPRRAPPCPGGRRSGRRRRRACPARPSARCRGPTCRRGRTAPSARAWRR